MRDVIRKKEVIAYSVLSFVFIVFLWWHPVMTPLRFYTTAMHETWHALAALLTGGSVDNA